MKTISLTIGCLVAAVCAQTAFALPAIVHAPVLQAVAGSPVIIQGTVSTAKPLRRVVLRYRSTEGGPFKDVVSAGDVRSFSFEIPGGVVNTAGVEYYVEAVAEDGSAVVPIGAPEKTYTIPVSLPAQVAAFAVVIITPEQDEEVTDPQPVLFASSDSSAGLDPKSVRILLDGKDVTALATIGSDSVTFSPSRPLKIGKHSYRIEARDLAGAKADPVEIGFMVTSEVAEAPPEFAQVEERPLTGQLTVESQLPGYIQAPSDKLLVANPKYNRATLSFRGKGDGFTVLGSGFVTDEERPGTQPISRFRMDFLAGDSFALTGGDFSPQLSELTVWRPYRIRGGQVQLRTLSADRSQVRLVVFGGMSQFPVEGEITGYDASGNPIVSGGTLAQTLFGSRAELDWFKGFTTAINFADMRDSAASVTVKPTSLQPQFNQLLSADTRLVVGPVFAEGEVAGSLYSRDQSLISLATIAGGAYRVKGGYSDNGHAFTYSYQDTGLEVYGMRNFQTLANPMFQPDYRGHRFEGATHAFQRLLSVGGFFEAWRDNLQDVKMDAMGNSNTTKVNSYGGDVRLSPVAAPSVGLGLYLQTQKDSSPLAQHIDTSSLNLSANVTSQSLSLGTGRALVFSTVNYSTYKDQALVPFSPNMDTVSVLSQATVDLTDRWQVGAGGSITDSRMKSFFDSSVLWPAYDTRYVSGNLRIQHFLIPAKLVVSGGLDAVFSKNSVSATGVPAVDAVTLVDARRLMVQSGVTWRPARPQALTAALSLVDSSDNVDSIREAAGLGTRSYQEFVANLKYSYEF